MKGAVSDRQDDRVSQAVYCESPLKLAQKRLGIVGHYRTENALSSLKSSII